MPEQQPMNTGDSIAQVEVKNLRLRVDRLETHIEATLDKIFVELKEVRSRLPTWATLLLSFLFLILGACLSSYFK